MADNVTANSGSGGAVFATDDIGSVHYPRVKISHGADGSATDVSTASPMPVGDAGGSLTVDNAALAVVGAGAEATALRVTLADEATVGISGTPAVSVSGTATVAGTVTASNTAGDIAHDAADSGNPVKVGGVARTSIPAAVADGDRANLSTDAYGRALVGVCPLGAGRAVHLSYTTQQTGGVVIDPTAGKRIAITSITVATKSTTSGLVTLWFGANADTTYTIGTDKPVEVATFIPSATLAPGLAKSYSDPITSDTADDELHITTSAAVNLDIVVHYFEF